MRSWDEKLARFPLQPFLYKRFIDDGFGIWEHGQEALEQFYKHANSIHPNIKVELRYSAERIEFLDTMVIIDGDRIETDLYTKPTDKHIYVQSKSNHPKSVKKSLPYGLALRIKRICSRERDYLKHREELKAHLRKRGYSSRFLEFQICKVDKLERSNLLQYRKQKKTNERVPLVITYAKQLPDIHKITKKHLNLLHKSDRMKTIFKAPPIVAFRRDRNLGDILVHGKHNKIFKTREENTDTFCSPKCQICPRILTDNIVKGTDQPDIRIKSNNGCETWNAVYGIKCERCERVVYVGETERTVSERLKEHLADVRHSRNKAVAEHFNQPDHSISDFKIVILEKCTDPSRYFRKIRELFWIERLNTAIPAGLNKKSQLGVLWPDYWRENLHCGPKRYSRRWR